MSDIEKKVEELEKRIEKLEKQHEKKPHSRTNRFVRPGSAYDPTLRSDLRRRRK